MSRTRKHKYGRKLHHKKRTVSRNKIKRKMKIKSRKIKQKIKKSHMRYAKKSMKHRIQRGGAIEENYKNLMTAYNQTEPSQTADNLYQVTAEALDVLKLHHTERGLTCFRDLILNRRLFSLSNDIYLSLEDVLTMPKLDLTSDTVFLLTEKTKKHDANMKTALENWLEFIERAHKILHPKIPHIDKGDIKLLNLKIDILQGKIAEARKHNETKLVDLYAGLVTEIAAFVAQHSKDAPPERKNDFDFFAPAAKRTARSAIPPIEFNYFGLDELRNVVVPGDYLKPYKGNQVLNINRVQNQIVKQYLKYRLSDDRTGSSLNTQETINMFNHRIIFIIMILAGYYEPRKLQLDGYGPKTSEGKKLFILLSWLNLIPVFGQGDDPYGRYDYVPDTKCEKSVSGKDFSKKFFSSGKSHCRTCGRCMNNEDTKEEMKYKVCVDCFELFNPPKEALVSSRGPGGAVVPSSFRSPSPRLSSQGAAAVSLSPRLSSQGAAAVSSSSPDITLPPRMNSPQRKLQRAIDSGL